METIGVVTPNLAMLSRSQTTSYTRLQKPEMKKKTKNQLRFKLPPPTNGIAHTGGQENYHPRHLWLNRKRRTAGCGMRVAADLKTSGAGPLPKERVVCLRYDFPARLSTRARRGSASLVVTAAVLCGRG
ncbi:MAG TPA: hypothetical protein VME43_01550 [Bryobacteraceae bacterium]|nr:hypothetical protein [Bryobacteraceae bacterium]